MPASAQLHPAGIAKSKQSPIHLDYIDGLRGMAALFVVLHHAYEQTWPTIIYPDSRPPRLIGLLLGWLTLGHFAVTFFIAVSGFCLMIPVIRSGGLRGGIRGFALGRVRRILPPYYAALLLSIVIAGLFLHVHTHTLYDASLPVTGRGILFHLLLIHNWFQDTRPQINGPFWSIAVESQIYVLFPLFVSVLVRRGIATFVAVAAGISTLLMVFLNWSFTPQYVLVFVMGMLAALPVFGTVGPDRTFKVPGWLKILGACAALVGVGLVFRTRGGHWVVADIIVGLMSAWLLASTGNQNNPIRRLASFWPIVWVGGFSYSLYLIHFPLQQLFWQAFVESRHLRPLFGFGVVAIPGTALIILISFVFYRMFEKPFMRSRPKA